MHLLQGKVAQSRLILPCRVRVFFLAFTPLLAALLVPMWRQMHPCHKLVLTRLRLWSYGMTLAGRPFSADTLDQPSAFSALCRTAQLCIFCVMMKLRRQALFTSTDQLE